MSQRQHSPLRAENLRGDIPPATAGRWSVRGYFLAFTLFATCLGVCRGSGRLEAAEPAAGFRQLAPGALTIVPSDRSADDPIQRGPLVEVTRGQQSLRWTPKRAAVNSTFVERASQL